MSVLARSELLKRLDEPDLNKALVVTPLLSREDQVGAGSIDLRLSNEFILFRQRSVSQIDVKERDLLEKELGKYQEKVVLEFRTPLAIHPGQLVLASTFEYVKLPCDLAGFILGRSSWGRLGLVIETASFVSPGFRGCITLELANIGQVPLKLYPGMGIAQLVVHTCEGEGRYDGRYRYPTGPQFPRVHDEKDLAHWYKDE